MPFLSNQRPTAPWSNHNWWGQWSSAADLPNVAGSSTSNWSDLQAGDEAWAADVASIFVCVDATPGAAIWTRASDLISTVTPLALPAGLTSDYSGIGFSTFGRLSANAAGSSLDGIDAPLTARILYIVNLGPGLLTIVNQDVSVSAPENRIITYTAAAVVLAIDDVMTLLYDIESQRYRQTSGAV